MATNKKKILVVAICSFFLVISISILFFLTLGNRSKDEKQFVNTKEEENVEKDNIKNTDVETVSNEVLMGTVDHDQVWQDKITIVGDLYIDQNATVTIEEGTKVVIAARQDKNPLEWDDSSNVNEAKCNPGNNCPAADPNFANSRVGINVAGKIVAIGSSESPISFLPDVVETPFEWSNFYINDGEFDNVEIGNLISIVLSGNVSIKNSTFHTTVLNTIGIKDTANVEIDNCRFYSCGPECVFVNGKAVILNSYFSPSENIVSPYVIGSQSIAVGELMDSKGTPELDLISNIFEGSGIMCITHSSSVSEIDVQGNTFIKQEETNYAFSIGEDPPAGVQYRNVCKFNIVNNDFQGFSPDPGKAKLFIIFPGEEYVISGNGNTIENYSVASSLNSYFSIMGEVNLEDVVFDPAEVFAFES